MVGMDQTQWLEQGEEQVIIIYQKFTNCSQSYKINLALKSLKSLN